MLDADTKRRIDTARDILVGKVPDPKSQVEQITIALIYKFMDDIDAESEELGGKRQFFADGFARYGWANLMRPGLGGHETLNLYADAITRMPENPGIPPLFRDIFNNAYLPYRDPETLRAFLKIINEFSYDHSERLGDAFEYLLSVLGSQGDAGQFRTPRHIIDFIVAVVDPKKDEVVLDPACGTAGFLISSYKHILAANSDDDGSSTLTPDERGRLADNFKGYDISPDMVRLSLVNMYLHGFVDPHISEYDTLTSDERWNEYADVILANPPFMSPKGGIRPHNRFSVKSKRSEVLFVDYMAEHLTPTGRAGIIVPEGIIFQSQKAHTALRKMLVEEYLVAVVSLPAGVFNPYSGVKTSVLILDKALARRTDRIAFFKVDADGYHLGAQRRPVDRNDLPQAQAELTEYLARLRAGASLDDFAPNIGLIVEKDRVAADGDYNLSGERYRVNVDSISEWPMAQLGDVFASIRNGINVIQKEARGKYKVTRIQTIADGTVDLSKTKWTDDDVPGDRFMQAGDILLSHINSESHLAKTAIFPECADQVVHGINLLRLRPNTDTIESLFALYVMKSDYFVDRARSLAQRAVNQASINVASLRRIAIPLPPLEVQQEIVAEIEGYQRVIDGARAVVENYRPHIAVDPEWPVVALGEVCERIQYGLSSRLNTHNLGYKTFRMNELVKGRSVDGGNMKFSNISAETFQKYQLVCGDILFNRTNSIEHVGRTGIFALDGPYCFASYLIRLSISKNAANPFYVNAYMNTESFQTGIKQYASRAIGQSNINAKSLAGYLMPLPPIGTQNRIVEELEAEQALVASNRELIERMEKKIQAAIGRVWGEDATLTNKDGRAESSKPGKSGVLSEQIQSETGR